LLRHHTGRGKDQGPAQNESDDFHMEDWFVGVGYRAIAPGAIRIESKRKQRAVIFSQTFLT
jgi:hypothetical protein